MSRDSLAGGLSVQIEAVRTLSKNKVLRWAVLGALGLAVTWFQGWVSGWVSGWDQALVDVPENSRRIADLDKEVKALTAALVAVEESVRANGCAIEGEPVSGANGLRKRIAENELGDEEALDEIWRIYVIDHAPARSRATFERAFRSKRQSGDSPYVAADRVLGLSRPPER